MADFNPNLAAFAALANQQPTPAATSAAPSDSLAQQVQQLLAAQDLSGMGAGSPAAANPAVPGLPPALAAGAAKRTASLNVPLPQPLPGGQPPPTPNAQVPGGPPPTPNAQVPQGPPQTPNAPQGPPPPPPTPPLLSQMIDPARVIQGPVTHANMGAALGSMGRFGDNTAVHARTGEQMVPSEMMAMHPELRDVLDRVFAQHGMARQAHQVGHPAGNVNPVTGMQEGFSFLDILPLVAAAAGSMFVGPELLAPALGGGALANFAAPVIASTVLGGGASELLHPERGPLNNFGSAGLGAIGGQVAGSLFSGGANAAAGAGANATAGAGANAAASTPVGNPLPGEYGPPLNASPGYSALAANLPATATAAAPAAAAAADQPGFFSRLMSDPMKTLMPHGVLPAAAGLLGGYAGSMVGDQLFPAKNASKIANAAGGDQNPKPLSSDELEQLRRRYQLVLGNMPDNQYLQTYGASPATPPVKFLGFS